MRLYTHTHTHTLYLLNNEKEKNKINERDICANASNCSVHKINSNYKLTNENMQTSDPSCRVKDIFFLHDFERKMLHPRGSANMFKLNKIESNTVGADAFVSPQTPAKKYINISMFQHQTSNTAITLIALIITIIVLLILAGVTLNMVMENSGILSKANSAKEQTHKKTAEEIIKLAVLENETDKATGNNYLENSKLKEKIVTKLKEQGYKVEGNKVTYYEDKTINIEDFLTKDETKEDTQKTTNITAQDVQKHPDWYYGKTVNYTSINGQSDWKIFYSDGIHIFLIVGDYINFAEKDRIDTNTQMSANGYNVFWNSVPNFQTVSDEVRKRFLATEYNLQSELDNSKCVSTLINPENWRKYLDSENGEGKAEYAIGSPNVEIWMASWNARYPNDKLYYKAGTNEPGYYVGTSENPSTTYIDYNNMNKKEGYKNKLYWNIESNSKSLGYWLSSPAAGDSSSILYANCSGINSYYCYNYGSYSTNYVGIRPIVSLKVGTIINTID